MEKKYKEIEFDGCTDIEKAVAILQKYNRRKKLVCGTFNGHILYSDKVTIDSAYLELFGKSKEDFEKERQACLENLNQEHAEYESKLPELMDEWIAKGQEILAKEYWDKWEVCVLKQSNQLYENLPPKCLDIVEALNADCSLKEAKEMLEQQGHSGASLGLILEMIKQFSHRGAALADLF